ncbi:hypothetical protein DL769_005910 [Monosporascus sp. CRB-8-3]|nr:hypothetical protein DL769_005910 [Monosporascus sp. CRB-8-3]
MTSVPSEPQQGSGAAKAMHEAGQLDSRVANLDRHSYLFGKKVTHSLSPFLHSVVYDDLKLNWAQLRLDSDDMDLLLQLLRHPRCYGASVTMPNKVAILPHLDDLTPECRAVGACNTIFLRTKGSATLYCGANTDVVGIRESFYRNVDAGKADGAAHLFHDKPAMVIGAGGAARSAVYALRTWMRARDIYLVNRDVEETLAFVTECTARGFGQGLVHVRTPEQAQKLAAPGAVVACVPDSEPHTPEELQARAVTETFLAKEGKGVMLEMCYNPSPFTRLGALAGRHGWKVILGTEALIWQGLEQDRYWIGREVGELSVGRVQRAICEAVKRNPGSKIRHGHGEELFGKRNGV